MKLPIRIVGAVIVAVACAQVAAATPPAIVAKRAQAARVLAEISALDQQLNATSEAYDGARYRLAGLRVRLRSEQASLAVARHQYSAAEQRAAKLLVYLYTSNRSSSLEVILGASSLSQMLQLSDAENVISNEAAQVAAQADKARLELRERVAALEASRAAAQATVDELDAKRVAMQRGLAQRARLLIKVEAQVARLEAQERARQARLAAEARARLAAEARARLAAEAAARARAQAAARALAARRAAAAAARERAIAAASARKNEPDASVTPTTTTAAASTSPAATTPTGSDPLAAATTTSETAAAGAGSPATTTALTTSPTTTPAAPLQGAGGTTAAGTAPATAITTTTTTPTSTSIFPTAPALPLPAGYPQAAAVALQYLGVPYVWGGESPSGFDCSGLVAYVYAQLGVSLPHFAAAQYTYGAAVPESQLQPGDLVFFDNLNHVGIYIGDNEFVDAPHTGAFVQIETLSDPWYTAHYVGARRL